MAAVEATVGALDPVDRTLKIENTEKRDTLIAIEKSYQQKWAEERVFETDAPSTEEVPFNAVSADELRSKHPKFFGTMAYPYMNGSLHVGHGFTYSKIEFAAGVARMQGLRTNLPLGYHCTGMPINSAADKIAREVEMFGKNFERCPVNDLANGISETGLPAPTQEITKTDVTKFSATKGKAAAKTVKMKYQFQIMLSIGIPLEEIHLFAEPMKWLQHFPPICKQDLTGFGARIDWRRSMVTTDANLFYDAFVRWQMVRLKEAGKIRFGKRYTVYSPKDGQACMDHDRSQGEGVGVQEYTALKIAVKEWPESAQKSVSQLPKDARCFFVAATLRPETVYGQLCCFVGPSIRYGIYKVSNGEYYVLSERAARNMSFQGVTAWGEVEKIVDVLGSDLVGAVVAPPLSANPEVRILPMESVKASKGTGIVMCVPSDSPDDYVTLRDLAKKADYYGIRKEWADLEIVPIIETPTYGNLTAKAIVEQMKINSPKDAKQLAEAKDLAYKEGFYRGVMIYGPYKGKTVEEAKPLVRAQLLEAGEALAYAETDGMVVSRSGDECVAAHLDQWYMAYGKKESPEWQQEVLSYVTDGEFNSYSADTKNALEANLDWLGQWACARSYGLGTRLPWDPDHFKVESLSDSTCYMAYYTIAPLLHKDIFGKELGPANVKPEQMTLEVNISGKDLLGNHLLFFLYVHCALFPKKYWPRGIRANGHALLNSEKQSKSSGNFLTLSAATAKYGADAARIAMGDAGDGIEDANFEESVANSSILKLFELKKWCEEMIFEAHFVSSAEEYAKVRDSNKVKNTDSIQRTGSFGFFDKIFENELNGLVQQAKTHYGATNYKLALKAGLYDLTSARDSYRSSTAAAGVGMCAELVSRYIEYQALMLAPIAPHWADYVWTEVLKKPSTIQNATFPNVPDTNPELNAQTAYVRGTSSNITSAEGAQQKKMAKGKTVSFDPTKDKKLIIFAQAEYPKWQAKYVDLVRDAFDGLTVDVKTITTKAADKSAVKKAMPFVQSLKKQLEGGISPNVVFNRQLAFDELATLREIVPVLLRTVPKLVKLEIVALDEGGKSGVVIDVADGSRGEERSELPALAEAAIPGSPSFSFENV